MDRELLKKRAEFIQSIRTFFTDRGYIEVDTPLLCPFLIPEPSLEVFKTSFINSSGESKEFYLAPSPELWMKRLIAKGTGNIFQISKSFRNFESLAKLHNPEFTLLEWYTIHHDYTDSMLVAEKLLDFVSSQIGPAPALSGRFRRLSMKAAFHRAGLDLDSLMDRNELFRVSTDLGFDPPPEDSWEQLFNRIFLTLIEPHLPEGVVILYDYPQAIPTLARCDGNYAERWELYINRIEVANCYTEETSRTRLIRLFESESKRKKKGCIIDHRVDHELPLFFNEDYPECSGVALGIDRLFMILSGLDRIDRVISFPFSEFTQ